MNVFAQIRLLSPARQMLMITVGVVVISVAIAATWYWLLRTPYVPLFSNLKAGDAATIVADLERKKIAYQLSDDGTTILVPTDVVSATRLNVMTEDLPLKGTVGFELFNKSDMGLTDFAQKINYQRALQGELARTIMTLDGVEDARVHISLGEDRIFRDDRVPPTASVTIRMQKHAALNTAAAQGIQRLVAAAVPKLAVSNVVILDEEGRVVGSGNPASTMGAPESADRGAIEQYYQALVVGALRRAYPVTTFTVSVGANLPENAPERAWTPAARQFPLHVSISPGSPLDDQALQDLRLLVAAAIGSVNSLPDQINIAPAVETSRPALAEQPEYAIPRPHARKLVSVPDVEEKWSMQAPLAFVLLLLALGAMLMFVRHLRGPRRMSDAERAEFVVRLRAVLQQGERHAAVSK